MFDARAALNDDPAAAYKQAISDLVVRIKAIENQWASIAQFVVFAGASTVATAIIPIKNDRTDRPAAVGMNNSDITLKGGARGNGTSSHIQTAYTLGDFGSNNIYSYGFFSEAPTSNGGMLYGAQNTNAGAWGFSYGPTTGSGTRGRSLNFRGITNGLGPGGYGIARDNGSTYRRIAPGSSSAELADTSSTNSAAIHIHARSGANQSARFNTSVNTFGNGRILVWALGRALPIGQATVLDNFVSPVADFVAALNAIP